jgi:hypothetical protein
VKEKDSFFPKKLGVLLEGDNRYLVKPNTLNSKGISYVCEKMMCRDDIYCKHYAFMLTSYILITIDIETIILNFSSNHLQGNQKNNAFFFSQKIPF